MKKNLPGRTELEQLAGTLRAPASYWSGPLLPAPLMPRNILAFHRHRASELQEGPRRGSQHQHHRFVLLMALRGAGTVYLDAGVAGLREGEALLILPFQLHYYGRVPSLIRWLFVTFDHAADARLESLRFRPRPLDAGAIGEAIRFLRAWRARRAEASLHLGQILHLLLRRLPPRPVRPRRPAADEVLLARLNRFAYENRHRAVSLREAAAAVGASASLLRQKFRAATGRSLGRHLRRVRLEYACSLLCNTSLRIGEVADRCGYDSLFSFSRAFTEAYGASPRAYRSDRSEAAGQRSS